MHISSILSQSIKNLLYLLKYNIDTPIQYNFILFINFYWPSLLRACSHLQYYILYAILSPYIFHTIFIYSTSSCIYTIFLFISHSIHFLLIISDFFTLLFLLLSLIFSNSNLAFFLLLTFYSDSTQQIKFFYSISN